jgi:hypothetical protein
MKTCTACWRPPGSEEQTCGEPAPYEAADSYFCDYHYERAIKWAAEVARIETSLVYYARRESDSIKIGTSRTIASRWTTLRQEHGPLILMAAHRGAHREEHMIHDRFAALRVEGEWFRPGLPLIEHILKARKVTDLRATEELPPLLDLLELGRMFRRLKREAKTAFPRDGVQSRPPRWPLVQP